MTDQGKPSVCPKCGSKKKSDRRYRASDGRGAWHEPDDACSREPQCLPCGDDWHSSPVPAATRRDGHSKLVWNKENQKIETVSAPQAESEWTKEQLDDPETCRGIGQKGSGTVSPAQQNKSAPSVATATADKSVEYSPSVPAGKDAAHELAEKIRKFVAMGNRCGLELRGTRIAEWILELVASETAALRAEWELQIKSWKAEELVWRQNDHENKLKMQQMQAGAEALLEYNKELRAERDKLAETVRKLCDSMVPHPKEHPTMYAAKLEAQKVLGSVKLECEIKELREGK